MKKQTAIILLIIIGFFCFLRTANVQADGPTVFRSFTIDAPTTWTKEGSPYIIENYVNIHAPLTIDPGVVVKLGSNARISAANKLIARGNENEKIVFTSWKDDSYGGDTNNDGDNTSPAPGDWYSIVMGGSNVDADLENVSFYYGAPRVNVIGAISVNTSGNVILRNNEIKYSGFAGIWLRDSQPIIENNLISNNNVGILQSNYYTKKVAVLRNNSIVNNTIYGAYTGGTSPYQIDAKNNWWGDKSGPYFKSKYNDVINNLDGKGNPVSDGVYFDPWLKRDPLKIRKPVILVPGIGASVNPDLMIGGVFNDNWTLLSHTYDGIIEAFKNMGYEEGKDLFIGYYDWRQSNIESAERYLKPLIQKANTLNGTSKVNIVAHSMGGLVARSYIESANFNNDVDNLIMIATPNKGASDVYTVWEGGHIPKNWENSFIMYAFLRFLSVKGLTLNDYQSVHQYIPSVKELMPLYNYIHPKGEPQNLKDYSQMVEVNNFLQDLNSGIDDLNQKVKVSIIAGQQKPTVNYIPVIDSDVSDPDLWKDGKPDPIDPERNDTNGDGEVMLSSAQIQSQFFDIMNYNHREIVSQSESIIAQRIDETLDNVYYSPQVNDELGFWFASPVDVEIKAPDGNIITSKNINEIPLAKFAGESKPDGFKIFSIPNPREGEYEIKITGNGEGEYHIGSEYLDYIGQKQDSSSLVHGEIKKEEEKEYLVAFNPKNEKPAGDIKPKDITPPVITITSPEDGKNYVNNSVLEFNYNATDDISGVKSTSASLDGKEFSDENIDLSLFSLGTHLFEISSVDNAGNSSSENLEFNVVTNISAISQNVDRYAVLKLITSQKAVDFLQVKLKDIAHTFNMIEKMNGKDNSNPAENKTKLLNQQIDDLISQIQNKKDLQKDIDPTAQRLLIESLKYIKL